MNSTVERLMFHPQETVWKTLFDPDAGRQWAGAAIFELAEQAGAPFCWMIDAGARTPGVTYGRVTDVIRPETLALRMVTFHGHHEVAVSLELTPQPAGTLVGIRLDRFPDFGAGPFELDGYTHTFDHALEALDTLLAGAMRSIHHRHRARIGIVPVGADPEHGLLVHDVTIDTPAEAAGLRAGDLIMSTSDGVWFNSQEDLDRWMESHEPGDQVRLRLRDREVPITFDRWPTSA